MLKHCLLALSVALLCSCNSTALQVVPIDQSTGYFPTTVKAHVVKSVAIDLDSKKALLLAGGGFTAPMVRNIGYFDKVIDLEQLQRQIVQQKLSEQIPSVSDPIGISNASKKLGGFLWLHWHNRVDGSKKYMQLKLTDPTTLDDDFVAETYLDTFWTGVDDQHNTYPLINALIDYIKKNSKTFRK